MSSDSPAENRSSATKCTLAWTHQFIDPGGRVKPCCRFNESGVHAPGDLNRENLNDIFLGPAMQDIRAKMERGERIPGCRRCDEEEAAGKARNLRRVYSDPAKYLYDPSIKIDQPVLRFLELTLSNQCNLKCRICSSRFSRLWWEDERALWGRTAVKEKIRETPMEQIIPHLSEVRHIKFSGGEPLMMAPHLEILRYLVSLGVASKIHLDYITNCTIAPHEELIDLWSKFHSIELTLSLDGVGKVAEYVRSPSKWPKVEKVTRAFLDLKPRLNINVMTRPTMNVYTIYHLPELLSWWAEANSFTSDSDELPRSVNAAHLTFPTYLALTVLPIRFKRMIEDRLTTKLGGTRMEKTAEYMIRFMNSRDDSALLPHLKYFTLELDRLRGENFLETFPHYEGLFDGVEARASQY